MEIQHHLSLLAIPEWDVYAQKIGPWRRPTPILGMVNQVIGIHIDSYWFILCPLQGFSMCYGYSMDDQNPYLHENIWNMYHVCTSWGGWFWPVLSRYTKRMVSLRLSAELPNRTFSAAACWSTCWRISRWTLPRQKRQANQLCCHVSKGVFCRVIHGNSW